MADNDDNATPFAAGTLSLDYVNSLFRNYAGPGADYAVTSQMRWAFNPASELRQAPDAASQDTVAKADTASLAQGDLAKDRGGSTREPSKASLKASPKGQQPVELSEREKSCLGWTALGKSSWEIGQILSISENTVVFHIKNAMRKLGTKHPDACGGTSSAVWFDRACGQRRAADRSLGSLSFALVRPDCDGGNALWSVQRLETVKPGSAGFVVLNQSGARCFIDGEFEGDLLSGAIRI